MKAYNELVRWKKYDSAGAFRTPEDRTAFMVRYLAVEDDLNVESMEIRSVVWPPVTAEQPIAAEVVIVASAYLLPSTVVEKVIIQQRWEFRDGRWMIVESDKELAPPVDDEPESGLTPERSPATEPDPGASGAAMTEPAGG